MESFSRRAVLNCPSRFSDSCVCSRLREGSKHESGRGSRAATARLLADENTSRRFAAACRQFDAAFPIIHISDWNDGAYLSVEDPALLMALRESEMILAGFDRASVPMHAGQLTREGLGHAGVILFRRSVPAIAYGRQARLLVNFWREAADWVWADRIECLPRPAAEDTYSLETR